MPVPLRKNSKLRHCRRLRSILGRSNCSLINSIKHLTSVLPQRVRRGADPAEEAGELLLVQHYIRADAAAKIKTEWGNLENRAGNIFSIQSTGEKNRFVHGFANRFTNAPVMDSSRSTQLLDARFLIPRIEQKRINERRDCGRFFNRAPIVDVNDLDECDTGQCIAQLL